VISVGDIEVDVVEHCNLRCAQCSHLSPHFKKSDSIYSLNEFNDDVAILSKFMKCKVFRFVGGEPLLNKEIASWARVVKEHCIAQKLSIFTNGLLLDTIDYNTLELFDDIRISVYNHDKETFNKILHHVEKLKQSLKHNNIVENHIKTFLKFNLIEKNTDDKLVQKIFDNCYHKKDSYSVYKGRLYRCFAARKKAKFLEKFKKIIKGDFSALLIKNNDSIALNSNLTERKLFNFLFSTKPLESCKWCLGCSGKRFENHQLNSSNTISEFATLKDLDMQGGKSYVSNCLSSWHRDKKHELLDDEFYSDAFSQDFNKYHSSTPAKKL